MDAQELIEYCRENNYCPYFFSRKYMSEVKLIACSFPWVLDPSIMFQLLNFMRSILRNCILIIDECHNVIEYSTEATSEKISISLLSSCLNEMRKHKVPPLYVKC